MLINIYIMLVLLECFKSCEEYFYDFLGVEFTYILIWRVFKIGKHFICNDRILLHSFRTNIRQQKFSDFFHKILVHFLLLLFCRICCYWECHSFPLCLIINLLLYKKNCVYVCWFHIFPSWKTLSYTCGLTFSFFYLIVITYANNDLYLIYP